MKKQNSTKKRKRRTTMAERADRHRLYEQAVQSADADVAFVDETFRARNQRTACRLREDFCGTMNNSCAWVKLRAGNRAIAVDLDPQVLAWGRAHHIGKLSSAQADRIRPVCMDVLEVESHDLDVVLALNFSYWVFRTRDTMLHYFRRVHAALAPDGMFILDAYGGYEAFKEMRESTRRRHFTYVWDQSQYDPVSGDYLCKIHFRFRDGSMLKEAFVYHWRLWTLPELIEILAESGFRTTVYWEGTAPDGSGNGIFTPVTRGDADACWIAYLVAQKT